MIASWQESCNKHRQCAKKQRHHFANKDQYSQGYNVFSSRIWLWELDHKEDRVPKNWCFWIVLKKTFESPLDSKGIKPIIPKWNQPWIFIGGTETEVEAPVCWPPVVNSWFTKKDLDAGKEWRQKEKRAIEDEMVGWHHWYNGHGLGQTPGNGGGQEKLECWSPWGHKELDKTWQLNNKISFSRKLSLNKVNKGCLLHFPRFCSLLTRFSLL